MGVETKPQPLPQDDIRQFRESVPCTFACPVATDVPGYLRALRAGDSPAACSLNADTNLFPGILGRICSRPCEKVCRHGDPDLGAPVDICRLKRFAADMGHFWCVLPPSPEPSTGYRIAVVGAGPAGLAAGYLLSRLGHRVDVLEMMPRAGGMLSYGIPSFRLPKAIVDREIGSAAAWGVNIRTGVRVGADISLARLRKEYDAVLITAGCYAARRPPLPGADLPGVLAGLEFMMAVNAGEAPPLGRRVLILGGGFTAVDCARAARRLGALDVRLCIRTTEEDLVVTRDQIVESKREGVRYANLVSAIQILGRQRVEGVRFRYTRLGGVRPTGERLTHPIEGSDFDLGADTVILAVGQAPDPKPFQVDDRDLRVEAASGLTDQPGVWAAGDFARGASTVIEAMGHARRVAKAIHRHLTKLPCPERRVRWVPPLAEQRDFRWDFIPRQAAPFSELGDRMADRSCETERGFAPDAGLAEARRCFGCDHRFEVNQERCTLCRLCLEECPRDCIGYAREALTPEEQAAGPWVWLKGWQAAQTVMVDHARCIRCGRCREVCPQRCVEVRRIALETVSLRGGGGNGLSGRTCREGDHVE